MYCHPVKIAIKKERVNMTVEEKFDNRKFHNDKRKKIKEMAIKKSKYNKEFNKLYYDKFF
tara:strand:+ start:178 stop:357 length:180 start_codon:yes stop_codon:yes gene_type:complete